MVRKTVSKKSESEISEEDKLFLQTYGSKTDFTDKDSIKPIVDYVRELI